MIRTTRLRTLRATIIGALAVAPILSVSASAAAPTWAARDTGTVDLWSIVHDGEKFVALAYNSSPVVKVSATGETWSTHNASTSGDWWRIGHGGSAGNEVFVILPDRANKVLRSSDGTTWNDSTTSVTGAWNDVAYGNGVFVAVGSNKVMYSTDDGLTWTEKTSTTDSALTGYWDGVAYGNGVFVAVGSGSTNNKVMTSVDGITWTVTRTNPVSPDRADPSWYSVTYGNGRFVAVANVGNCSNAACDQPVMWSDDNGANWIRVTTPLDTQTTCWQEIRYGNVGGANTFFAVGDCGSPRVMSSTDGGLTWNGDTSAPLEQWYSLAYGNGVFTAVGYGATKIATYGTHTPPTTSTVAVTTTVAATSPTTTLVLTTTPTTTTPTTTAPSTTTPTPTPTPTPTTIASITRATVTASDADTLPRTGATPSWLWIASVTLLASGTILNRRIFPNKDRGRPQRG